MSTRGVNDQILLLTSRMDASKAKKEASATKISFCGVNSVHLPSPLAIANQYIGSSLNVNIFFVDTFPAFM